MPFRFKNMGMIYQHLVNNKFKLQINRIVEVYIYDMLIKSLELTSHVADLQETFYVLRKYLMKLNPCKCAFGITSTTLLGLMITSRGIEVKPKMIIVILNMEEPRTI